MKTSSLDGAVIMARLDALAQFSEEPNALTRTYLSEAHLAAGRQLIAWMQRAGMQAHFDAVGNVVGRYPGSRPGLPALIVASHYDTVRNAGRYDGAFGVIAAIQCVDELHRRGRRLDFDIEVIAFADEEGVRFNAALLGSRAVAGRFDARMLELTDNNGITLSDALRHYGSNPGDVLALGRTPEDVLGYVEVHIEQGPVLLSSNRSVGVVTAIAGASRFDVKVTGLAGHAGTVPMALRRDAATAAAEAILYVEHRCCAANDLVGTVGRLSVPDGAVNVIPGRAHFSLDIRAGDDSDRLSAIKDIRDEFSQIASRRQVNIEMTQTHDAPSTQCSPALIGQLEAAIALEGQHSSKLVSGAGHDAMVFTDLTSVGLLFVRCGNGGISHHPDEIITREDAEVGTRVLYRFITNYRTADNGSISAPDVSSAVTR